VPGGLILTGGRLITADPELPEAEAIAIRGGIIVAVGSNADALAFRAPGVEVIDLKGRTVLPAFNDAHCHPMAIGLAAGQVDVSPYEAPDIGTLLGRIRDRAASTPPGRWILARGYDDTRLAERRHPSREELDRAAPHNPVLITRACLHVGAANTQALREAGITRDTPDPPGGTIDRDSRGEPTGVVREAALEMARRAVPKPTVDELEDALRRAAEIYHSHGVTSVAEAGVRRPEEMEAYQRVRESGGPLLLRTYLMVILDEMLEEFSGTGLRTGFGDDLLRLGPAKIFLDGSIGGHTARMREPYAGEPGNRGLWMQDPEEMKRKIRRAHALGWQCTAHAIGDASIDLLLDAYEEALAENPRRNTRHRIEHCEFVTDPQVFDRIARLGCVPVPGTTFLHDFRPLYDASLGRDRLRYANAMRSFIEHGIVAAASSDAPVCSVDPLLGIRTMMTRRDFAGEEAFPEESISFEEAVYAYTAAGAYASFEEHIKGSLSPGKVGDVTVLGADVRQVKPEEIPEIGVDLTVMAGEVVHPA